METAFGSMGFLFLLLGGLAIAGLAGGGGSDSDDTPETEPEVEPEPEAEALLPLSGSAGEDSLIGDASTSDINGLGGDDLIISAGANGTFNGGDGSDGVALNTGEGTLTGGSGADIFLVTGDETADSPTHGIVTDFDPSQDKLILSMQQSRVLTGQVSLNPQTAFLSITDTETPDGPALVVELAPRPGFESQTSRAGFAKATLLDVYSDELTDTNFLIGVDRFADDAEQRTLIETSVEAARNYDVFDVVTSEDNFSFQDESRDSEALFGLGGDDRLAAADFESVDIYGGGGDDIVSGGIITSGSLFGGDGDDVISTSFDNEMTGGAGIDNFRASLDVREVLGQTSVITDFDPAAETLELRLTTGDRAGTLPGDTELTFSDSVKDGVAGTLVTMTFFGEGEADDIVGPKVFLQSVTAADIPDGAITFIFRGEAPDSVPPDEESSDPIGIDIISDSSGRGSELIADDFQTAYFFGGGGDDSISGGRFTSGTFFGGQGDDTLVTQFEDELQGGDGIDSFEVLLNPEEAPALPPVITDFDPATETVELRLVSDEGFGELTGEAEVTVTDAVQDGVAGTLVSSAFRGSGETDDLVGPKVFLQGVLAANIPDGAITFIVPGQAA